jgi:IS30 family transposase
MSHHQLTQYQRHELGSLLMGNKHSLREIARLLGFHPRQARIQLQGTRLRANQSKRKLPTNADLVKKITKRLVRHDSPDQIAGWLKDRGVRFRVCAQTIYDWIYTSARELVVHLHCRKGKYRRTRESTLRKAFRNKQKEARSIDIRPPHILARKTYGHWEGDSVVGTGQSGSIATFVERKSGYLMAARLPDKGAKSFEKAAKHCFAVIATKYAQTLTLDNGIEMSNYEEIERSTKLRIYFAHPYHSWERGTNENTNGLLRFYFPKKMSFSNLTQQQLDAAVLEINTRPRKRLGY